DAVPYVYEIPLGTRFRGIERRRGVVWEGPAGWAEFSPFEEYPPSEAAAWWRAAREAAEAGFPPPVRRSVPVNVTIPAVGPARAEQLIAQAAGTTTAKVKVAEPGQTAAQEADRVAAVRSALGPRGRIRVDANGAWDVDTAVDRIRRLDRAAGGLEYAEQPCRTAEELARVRRLVAIPVAADESIRRAADPLRVKALQAADVVVLKAQPLGGVRACLRLAEALDLPVVVSSAVETSIGLAMGLALAAALPRLDFACGLGTLPLLEGDLVEDGLRPAAGELPVCGPVAPSPRLLQRWAAPAPVRAAWLERLDAARRLAGPP
ncbi:MAG: o-succinylbenzoate synthase, partial [Bifidobacteriaceae bacterium]|nr:o-succinylbenzoate synthase [Bifidobacteriaceae bacterium]